MTFERDRGVGSASLRATVLRSVSSGGFERVRLGSRSVGLVFGGFGVRGVRDQKPYAPAGARLLQTACPSEASVG